MRKFWLAIVVSVAMGGVLMPGIAYAGSTPTSDPGSRTMNPVMVVGSGGTSGTTTTDSSTPTTSTGSSKDADKAAKDAAKAADKATKDAAKAADEAAKKADEAAKKANDAAQKGKNGDPAHQGAPVPTHTPATAKAPWINDPSLFGGGGRTWG